MDKTSALRDEILARIASGEWPHGHRLPTEREFAAAHRLSRSTVRRTLAQLKARGLISQTVGSGTYVAAPGGEANGVERLQDDAMTTSPAQLMAARLALEPAIAALVVEHARPADFEHMRLCCERAEAADSFEDFETWDAALHEAIAAAAHNPLIENVFSLMNHARSHASWGVLKRRSLTDERRKAYQREHRALVDALCERDAMRATETARTHLLHVRRNLLGY
ncbi:FadR family transcriptional regulator [Verticiella sediminum]|uniref:FadR family transcriptional regulator n=1 Tax=Verticiella sediminum TaxID=1247510 RepID=A0A556AYP5_9BURK|nr:FCD domain-containing protein [Verticiella sediminum]TSH98052.1 FadR family transcriptional regulator [Verticiella sediminum]